MCDPDRFQVSFTPTLQHHPEVSVSAPSRQLVIALSVALVGGLGAWVASIAQRPATATDVLKAMQNEYVDTKSDRLKRAYHFGSQGADGVFSNHTSHTNRLIPVYVFGKKADLGAVTGRNSRYRHAEKVRELYGFLPENTVNPEAEYADQADLYRVQNEAVERGAKYVFTVWFDGLDWETTQAAAIYKTGKVYKEGKGSGLNFLDETADGSAQYGYVVTAPTKDKNSPDVDAQTVTIPPDAMGGGYDPVLAGPNPWTPGKVPGYLKGQNADAKDRQAVEVTGRIMHAYTDSAPSAAEYASGVKSYNNSINVADDGRVVETIFHQLQRQGWRVGTVATVPFSHASPAAMYARNVSRNDFQDLSRDMLGLRSIVVETGKAPRLPGLDVVIGTGLNRPMQHRDSQAQGRNAAFGTMYLADEDFQAIRVQNGGKYVVAQQTSGVNGVEVLERAAETAAREGHRLFGLFGPKSDHLPYRTADGRYDPSKGINGVAEVYSQSDLDENPSLADMTRAALTVLSAREGQPFALFVEAGDVDWALHDNNLDNAIGAVFSGEEAIQVILDWVRRNSNWDESVLIVTADHGHYLVIDDPEAIAAAGRARRN
jgi:alkaline phosphatase